MDGFWYVMMYYLDIFFEFFVLLFMFVCMEFYVYLELYLLFWMNLFEGFLFFVL